MNRLFLFAAAALLVAGCITDRRATFATPPGSLPFSNDLQSTPLQRSWAVGEVFVSAQRPANQPNTDNWSTGRRQIEERLSETLRRQPSLGHRAEDRQSAELIVDVLVELQEVHAMNAWAVPAVLSEFIILGVGAGAGAAIGSAAGPDGSPDAALTGSFIGLGLAIVPAVMVPLLFPVNDVVGNADATLTFRRASDGVVVLEKRTRAEWATRHNWYSVEDKLAEITGAGIEALEKQLVRALYEGLSSSPPAQHTDAARDDSAPLVFSDAPKRLLLPR